MSYLRLNIFLLVLVSLLATACDDDDPEIIVEEEVITTLNYTLTPVSGGDAVVLSFRDLDGDGGNAPEITGGTLAANTTYTGTMELLNESEDPVEDITEEIEEEDEEHQFFFSSSIGDVVIDYSDTDADNNPIGLTTAVTTGNAGSGTLTVILRHKPDKNAAGVKEGMIANAGGETDIEVDFSITVQ